MTVQPITFPIKINTDTSFEHNITFDSDLTLKALNKKVCEIFKENIEEKMVDIFISNPISLNLTPIEELVKNNTITLTALKSFKGSDIICSFKKRKAIKFIKTTIICTKFNIFKEISKYLYGIILLEGDTLNCLKSKIFDELKRKIPNIIKELKKINSPCKNNWEYFFNYLTIQKLIPIFENIELKTDDDLKKLFSRQNRKLNLYIKVKQED